MSVNGLIIHKQKSLETSRLFLAEEEGIEPPLTVLETAALPLYYSSICLLISQPTNAIIA